MADEAMQEEERGMVLHMEEQQGADEQHEATVTHVQAGKKAVV